MLQALHKRGLIDWIDYLSTVSGGGYIGSCLTASMSKTNGAFPFGTRTDVRDSAAVGHLRNYSNYLLPRGRSGVRNLAEAVAVISRGLLANACLVLVVTLFCALLTQWAFPRRGDLLHGSFIPSLLGINDLIGSRNPFPLTLWLIGIIAVVLLTWALLRSLPWGRRHDDVSSPMLVAARVLLITIVIVAFLDLQPVLIELLARLHAAGAYATTTAFFYRVGSILSTLAIVIAFFGNQLGEFLKVSQHSATWSTVVKRALARFTIYLGALPLPFLLLIIYLYITAWSITGMQDVPSPFAPDMVPRVWLIYLAAFIALLALTVWFKPNAYSLHQFYRDRLSKAFLFDPTRTRGLDFEPLDNLKLSGIEAANGPYHIINAALNIQGSAEANRRGRNADFFMFTRDFIGSDLTLFARTQETLVTTTDMEDVDPRLDLATAMAISGAAASSSMGSNTVKSLSPTLALLNIRLGYWLRNPRDLARTASRVSEHVKFRLLGKFYLLLEMFNLLDEDSYNIYLTDGGHIESLGMYELLKRGCQLIIAVDAETDPAMSFSAFVRLQRYARIDLARLIPILIKSDRRLPNRGRQWT